MKTPRQDRRRLFGVACITLVAAISLAIIAGCSAEPAEIELDPGASLGSLLAVGDTGDPWGEMPWLFEGQLAVGAAMQREHAAASVDAVVLLGDNFYPDGLLAHELVPRIVQNIARPYCAFIDPSEELIAQLDGQCPTRSTRPPLLLVAVGNHDIRSPGSLALQREAVPHFVRNWEVPTADQPVLRELEGGISLIFLVSESPWDEERIDALAGVLAQAQGQWRIIVGHRPPIAGHPQLSQMISRASKRSGRVVHAYLAGHVHALGALRGEAFEPALTVIAGSGAHADLQESPEYQIDDADVLIEGLGFVRVDSLSNDGSARLRVTLFESRQSAALAFLGHPIAARYEIAPDGSVERLNDPQRR